MATIQGGTPRPPGSRSFALDGVKRRAAGIWVGFTSGQKTMLALAVIGVLVGGMAFTKWAAQPTWAPLYTNLAPADAASVTQQLGSQGVKYQLADGGGTVMVPQGSVYQLRLDMSAKGLPTAGSPGYALLDKQGITTSEFRQRVDYQRALEGELARTLGAIDGVAAADVHLVIPSDDIFSQDASQPSASVLLHGKPGKRFSGGQVQSIVHLVASSVEGLDPGNVTVADDSGRTLSAPGEDGGLAAGDLQSTQSKEFEDHLAASLQEMLAPVTGAGGAVVRVKASLDFDERATTTERFENPATPPILSESTTKESFTGSGGGSGPGGLLGTDIAAGTGTGPSNYQKDQAERSFAVGKVTETVRAAPGRVSRLSVAVLLDDDTKAETTEVQALVAAAAGLDAGRGDLVEVRRMAFDKSATKTAAEQAKAKAAEESRSQTMALAQTAAVLLIVLVVLFLAWRSAKRATVKRLPLALPPGLLGAGGSEGATGQIGRVLAAAGVPAGQEAEALAALAASSRAGALAAGYDPSALGELGAAPGGGLALMSGTRPGIAAPITDEIRELIDHQPEEVAQILRSWLADRRS